MADLNYLPDELGIKVGRQRTLNKISATKKSCLEKGDRCIHFTLSYDTVWELMWNDRCFYCLRDPIRPYYDKDGYIRSYPLGMDRLDSNKSYTQLNTVACCKICNYAKSDQSIKRMLNWMSRLRPNAWQERPADPEYDYSLLEDLRFKALYKSKEKDAARRHKEWKLPHKEALMLFQNYCLYCWMAPSNSFKYGNHEPLLYNGIDRYNNDVGYIEGNCVSACKYCNRAKRDMPDMWWGAWVMQMQNNLPRLVREFQGRGLI